MLCRTPFIRDPSGKVFKLLDKSQYHKGIPFPCGQCLPCRINRRRVWTFRLSAEALSHPYASFVTLTYSPDGLFRNEQGHCSLSKRDVQLYLKRLRKAVFPIKIRYFCAGEYGELGQRPHYHLIIYGLSPYLQSHVTAMVTAWSDSDLQAPLGHVEVRECVHESMQYVAGYVCKKYVTKKDSLHRVAEFTLSSRKPGIGFTAIMELAKILQKPDAKKLFHCLDDGLPRTLRLDGRNLPLGRYCLDKLKDWLWIEETSSSNRFLTDMAIKFFHTSDKYDDENAVFGRLAIALMNDSEAKYNDFKARTKIYKPRRSKL